MNRPDAITLGPGDAPRCPVHRTRLATDFLTDTYGAHELGYCERCRRYYRFEMSDTGGEK